MFMILCDKTIILSSFSTTYCTAARPYQQQTQKLGKNSNKRSRFNYPRNDQLQAMKMISITKLLKKHNIWIIHEIKYKRIEEIPKVSVFQCVENGWSAKSL